jgi:hypothetical protein
MMPAWISNGATTPEELEEVVGAYPDHQASQYRDRGGAPPVEGGVDAEGELYDGAVGA